MMARLGNSFSKFLGGAGSKCTTEEMLYYDTLSLLCTLVSLASGLANKGESADVFGCVTESLRTALESLAAGVACKENQGIERATLTLRSLHGIAMLRETAWAVKLASRWILDYNDHEKERAQISNREVVAQIKGLQSAADAALGQGRELIKALASDEALTGRDAVARLRRWVLGDEETLRDAVEETAVASLVESWRKGVAGWKLVKWD